MVSCVKVERVQVVDSPGLGARIKAAREGSDRPLRELANEAGMTSANWYRIENEEVKRLPELTLRKIEAVLSVDLGVQFDNLDQAIAAYADYCDRIGAVFQQPSRVDSDEKRGVVYLRNVGGLLARYSVKQGKILGGEGDD